ncbi:MAG: DUF3791 domain-containing protein [Treponema sp.]|nr:DUF3791 domain-containing protein [Treponema sp.]
MSDNADFIAYCLEEYKHAKGITGKEAIMLFKQFKIIDYIVNCYGALHTMGGLAITEDIDSLIEDIKNAEKKTSFYTIFQN